MHLIRAVSRLRLRKFPPLAQDAIIGASTFVFGAVMYATGLSSLSLFGAQHPAPAIAHLMGFGAMCCLELLRRRAPALALCLSAVPLSVDALLGLSVPPVIVVGDLLYAGAVYGSRRVNRTMIPVVAVGTFAIVVAALVLTPHWRVGVIAALAAVAFLIVPVWWGTSVRQYADLAAAERTSAASLSRIAELDRAAAVADERARMARDLHDVIAGHLSAIAIQSTAALSIDEPAAAHAQALRATRQDSTLALEEMRTMIDVLRAGSDGCDSFAAPTGLAQLGDLVESARASGVDVGLRERTTGALPAAVDLAAYRITQEAVTNVVKHAPGSSASIWVRHDSGTLVVEIVNDIQDATRCGGDSGTGLLNMRERARILGGSVSAGPGVDGWTVRAELPTGGVQP